MSGKSSSSVVGISEHKTRDGRALLWIDGRQPRSRGGAGESRVEEVKEGSAYY